MNWHSCIEVNSVLITCQHFKVNKSVYIAYSRQQHNITLNNIFLHVLNHTLKKFLIEVFIDFIYYGKHVLIKAYFKK